jgi:hypothetical protein
MVVVIAGAVATRVRLLPEVIDVPFIPTGAGLGSLGFAFYGALRRYEPDRIGRVIAAAGGVAYSFGAPVWVIYVAIVLACFSVLPAYERWDQQHHP